MSTPAAPAAPAEIRRRLTRPLEEIPLLTPTLLGARLSATSPEGTVTVEITELECYTGDAASHARNGPTPRTLPMFGPAGCAYVYLAMGIHASLNITLGPDGEPAGALVRAGSVVTGTELARARRPGVADAQLARGPGNLGRALGITLVDSGTDLLDPTSRLRLTLPASPPPPDRVRSGPRVGITQATELPWRFWLEGEASVSAFRAGTRARRSASTAQV